MTPARILAKANAVIDDLLAGHKITVREAGWLRAARLPPLEELIEAIAKMASNGSADVIAKQMRAVIEAGTIREEFPEHVQTAMLGTVRFRVESEEFTSAESHVTLHVVGMAAVEHHLHYACMAAKIIEGLVWIEADGTTVGVAKDDTCESLWARYAEALEMSRQASEQDGDAQDVDEAAP